MSVSPVAAQKHKSAGAGRSAGGLEWVQREIQWHRTQARRAVYAALVLALVSSALVILDGVMWVTRPAPRYFEATPNGQIVAMTPLSRPVLSRTGLLNWTATSVSQTLSIDFANYRQQLAGVRGDYLPAAYGQVISGLVSSGNLRMITTQRLAVSASVTQAPILIAKGFIGHVLAWKIQFPLVVSYQSSHGVNNTQNLVATVVVERAHVTDYPRGVAIAQLVLTQGTS